MTAPSVQTEAKTNVDSRAPYRSTMMPPISTMMMLGKL
jgi:hypothetical protein